MLAENNDILDVAHQFMNSCISRATGGSDSLKYSKLRSTLIADRKIKSLLPKFVVRCSDENQFWQFIKNEFPTYDQRRKYIYEEFHPLIDRLEGNSTSLAEEIVTDILPSLNSEHVREIWNRALERRASDPDGAITLARTLLESVCKLILDELEIDYQDDFDLPKLYRLTSEAIKLSPSQYTEVLIKQILGGCASVVTGLGSLRNKASDAHGRGKKAIRLSSRHAELAVNLSGTMSMFLVSTWKERK